MQIRLATFLQSFGNAYRQWRGAQEPKSECSRVRGRRAMGTLRGQTLGIPREPESKSRVRNLHTLATHHAAICCANITDLWENGWGRLGGGRQRALADVVEAEEEHDEPLEPEASPGVRHSAVAERFAVALRPPTRSRHSLCRASSTVA
eukprot:1914532-Rhodomonas_salina.4